MPRGNRRRDKITQAGGTNDFTSWLRSVTGGSFYKMSDVKNTSDVSSIRTIIDTMRALALDSQIATALSYYATDATTTNTSGQILWAVAKNDKETKVAEIANDILTRLNVNDYARDHILELATVGNLYIPTTMMYKEDSNGFTKNKVAIDNNTIADEDFDIIPSTKIDPKNIVHLYYHGQPQGYIYQPDENETTYINYPENAIIHFSLGGLLGQYTMDTVDGNGEQKTYDIKFAEPLMARATQPTQTLNLLEDSIVLSSLVRTVRFVSVDCGNDAEEDEIQNTLMMIKNSIEQQLSINTNNGDAQSYVNPQSPNNLIYLPKVDGQDPISITDLNIVENDENDSKLLQYYQDKKLSVLGVPKEAMNFSSNEGLGGAGAVLAQRSALYANSLQRLETAYMEGWTNAINSYFKQRGYSGFINKFELRMNPIITNQSTLQFDRRDAALSQAQSLVQLLQSMNITEAEPYMNALVEILSDAFPSMGADVNSWKIDMEAGEEGGF